MTDRPYSVPPTGGVIVKHPTQELTLRDQFAMAALTGIVRGTPVASAQVAASCAYVFADAMLEARKEKK